MAEYLYPLRSNKNLQSEFLIFLKQHGNLAKLSDEVSTDADTVLWRKDEFL